MRKVRPLHDTWTFYVHAFPSDAHSYSYQKVGSFSTIGEFWQYYNNVPPVTAAFAPGHTLVVGGKAINAYSVFRAGVLPEWEDKANCNGSEWSLREMIDLDRVRSSWQELLLMCVGEAFPSGVVGVRVVHKPGKRSIFKLEVWMDSSADQEAVSRCIVRVCPNMTFTHISHSSRNDPKKRPKSHN